MAVIDFQSYRRGADYDSYRYDDDYGYEGGSEVEDALDDDPGGGFSLRRTVSSLWSTFLSIGLVALVVMLILLQTRSRTFSDASYTKIADIVSVDTAEWAALGDNIISYSQDGMHCMDPRGNLLWSITYEMQQPIVAKTKSIIAVGDYNGSRIYMGSAEKSLGSVATNMPLRGLAVSECGEVACVLGDSDVTWIYLFDVEGKTIAYFKTSMNQSGYPLSISISQDGTIVAVAYLRVGSSSVNTSIAYYNFGAVGANYGENNVSGYNYDDEIFPFMYYMDGNTNIAVSDRRIAFFGGSEIPVNEANALFSDELKGIYVSDHYAALLFPDVSGAEQYVLRIYNTGGTKVGEIPFSLDYSQIQVVDDRVVINSDASVLVYNVSGQLKYQGSFDEPVRAVIPSAGISNRLTVIGQTAGYQMILE